MSEGQCTRCGHLRRCHVTVEEGVWGQWCPKHPKPFPEHDFVPQEIASQAKVRAIEEEL